IAHHHFVVAEQLHALLAVLPEDHIVLDLLDLLDREIEIERVELVARHAAGHRRRFELSGWRLAHRARSREFLAIPEIDPILRWLRKALAVESKNVAVSVV